MAGPTLTGCKVNLWQQCCDPDLSLGPQQSFDLQPYLIHNQMVSLDGGRSFAIFFTEEDLFNLTQKSAFEFPPVSDGDWVPARKCR